MPFAQHVQVRCTPVLARYAGNQRNIFSRLFLGGNVVPIWGRNMSSPLMAYVSCWSYAAILCHHAAHTTNSPEVHTDAAEVPGYQRKISLCFVPPGRCSRGSGKDWQVGGRGLARCTAEDYPMTAYPRRRERPARSVNSRLGCYPCSMGVSHYRTSRP
jgi:hypothetical protein